MVGALDDRMAEWEGGSLSELVTGLQSAAQPVRIVVVPPGSASGSAGEVHLLAGGLADAFAGSLRRDDAVAALQRVQGARFLVETRLPDPDTGSLSESGPREGSLRDRPLAVLMRYCEEYVLTCRLDVWRAQERATIGYSRGEIVSTMVGGSDAPDRLPEVLAWVEGSYEIMLPAPILPAASTPRKRAEAVIPRAPAQEPPPRPDRKRHTTIPLLEVPQRPPTLPDPPSQAAKGTPTVASVGAAVAEASRLPTGGGGVQEAAGAMRPVVSAQAVRQPGIPPLVPSPPALNSGTGPTRAILGPAKSMAQTSLHAPPVLAEPMQPLATVRGTPPVPPVASKPLGLGQPAAQATAQVPRPVPPEIRLVQTPAQRPSGPPPASLATSLLPPSLLPSPASEEVGALKSRLPKPAAVVSNDLKPASGTIEARPKRASQQPALSAPIEVVGQSPQAATDVSTEQVPHPFHVASAVPTPRRTQVVRKRRKEHTVRTYIFLGLAIGLGVVVAYWLYFYLPFGH